MPTLQRPRLRLDRETVRRLTVSSHLEGRVFTDGCSAVCVPTRDCEVTFTCNDSRRC